MPFLDLPRFEGSVSLTAVCGHSLKEGRNDGQSLCLAPVLLFLDTLTLLFSFSVHLSIAPITRRHPLCSSGPPGLAMLLSLSFSTSQPHNIKPTAEQTQPLGS